VIPGAQYYISAQYMKKVYIRKHLLHSVYVFVFFITILERYLGIKTGQTFQEKLGFSIVSIGQFFF
jgi:hypothetical protein